MSDYIADDQQSSGVYYSRAADGLTENAQGDVGQAMEVPGVDMTQASADQLARIRRYFPTLSVSEVESNTDGLVNDGESFLHRMAVFTPAIEAMINRARFTAGLAEPSWVLRGMRSGDSLFSF